MNYEKEIIGCCLEECGTPLIEVDEGRAAVLANHAICSGCRSVVLCEHHYTELSEAGPLVCPNCNKEEWHLIHRPSIDEAGALGVLGRDKIRPIFAHSHPRATRLFSNGLLVSTLETTHQLKAMKGGHSVTFQGELVAAASSLKSECIAFSRNESRRHILEVSHATKRPWQFITEWPCQIDGICFVSESEFVAVLVRQDGQWELFHFQMQPNSQLSARRLCNLAGKPEGTTCPLLGFLSDDEIVVVRQGPQSPVLDKVQISTGASLGLTALSKWPSFLRVSPNGHVLLGSGGGAISLWKDGRMITLFDRFDFVDAVFSDANELCLASSNKGIHIDLSSGESTETIWDRAIIGLMRFL